MGIRKLGDTIVLDFVTHNPLTGFVQDTDSPPTCEVFEDENDTAILIPTVTKRTGKIGNYRVSIEAITGNGFAVGKSYNVIVSATVNLISAKSRVDSFTLDSKRNADLQDLSQSQIISDAIPFRGEEIDIIKLGVDNISNKIGTPSSTIADSIALIIKIESGRWRIINNQLIFYDEDRISKLFVFDLFDKDGNPSATTVYERRPV